MKISDNIAYEMLNSTPKIVCLLAKHIFASCSVNASSCNVQHSLSSMGSYRCTWLGTVS